MKKVYANATEALDGLLQDGMLIASGGFGLCGIPELLLQAIKEHGAKDLTFASNNAGIDDSKIARQGFGRGLCPVDDRFLAAGSSPSTITLYDTEANEKIGFVNLSMDIRNAIHGLEVWPYED